MCVCTIEKIIFKNTFIRTDRRNYKKNILTFNLKQYLKVQPARIRYQQSNQTVEFP